MPVYNSGFLEKIEDSSLIVRKKRHWVTKICIEDYTKISCLFEHCGPLGHIK